MSMSVDIRNLAEQLLNKCLDQLRVNKIMIKKLTALINDLDENFGNNQAILVNDFFKIAGMIKNDIKSDRKKILEECCLSLNSSVETIFSKGRKADVVLKRQAIMYYFNRIQGCTVVKISLLTNFNHSLVSRNLKIFSGFLSVGDKKALEVWKVLLNRMSNYNIFSDDEERIN